MGAVAWLFLKSASSASSAQNSEQKWSPEDVRQNSTQPSRGRNGSPQNMQWTGLLFVRYLLLVSIRISPSSETAQHGTVNCECNHGPMTTKHRVIAIIRSWCCHFATPERRRSPFASSGSHAFWLAGKSEHGFRGSEPDLKPRSPARGAPQRNIADRRTFSVASWHVRCSRPSTHSRVRWSGVTLGPFASIAVRRRFPG
jgi:hypothetical protein